MKRVFRIFDLSKSEQRVVLIIMFVLVVFAFVKYERRVHHCWVQPNSARETKISPSPVEKENEP